MRLPDCPDDTVLLQCTVGALDSSREAAVIDHVELCRACETRLAALERSPGQWAGQLALPQNLVEFVAEAGCAAALQKAREVPEGGDRAESLENTAAAQTAEWSTGTEANKRRPELANSPVTLPMRLGDYELLEQIGRGGMGVVYRGRHLHMDRVVAVKIIAPEMADREEFVKRFHREIRASAALVHPNIVTAHDASQSDGLYYLVMEYVEGEPLSDAIARSGQLSIPQALEFTLQAAAGLAFAHRKGVIHRDVKPGNMLVTHEGEVKLSDLGLAFQPPTEAVADVSLTDSSIVLGTAAYMSPEQASDPKSVDARSDIYSLGCSLFRMLTGEYPYTGETVFAVAAAHRDAPIPQLKAHRPDVPKRMNGICRRMMAKRPADRYQSMDAAIDDLRQARLDYESSHKRSVARRTLSKPLWGAAFVALIAVAVIGSFFIPSQWLKPTSENELQSVPPADVLENPTESLGDNVIGLIDLERDVETGPWKIRQGVLVSPDTPFAIAMLPVAVPEEYEISFAARPATEPFFMALGLKRIDGRMMVCFEVDESETRAWFETSVESASQPQSVSHAKVFTTEEFTTIKATVTQDVIQVWADGKELVRWDGPWEAKGNTIHWSVPGAAHLFLGTSYSSFEFADLSIKPITGELEPLVIPTVSPPEPSSPIEVDLRHLRGHYDKVTRVAWSHDGTKLATLGHIGDRRILIWNTQTWELENVIDLRITGFQQDAWGLSFSPNDDRLAAARGGKDGRIDLFEVDTGKFLGSSAKNQPSPWDAAFLDERRVLGAISDGSIIVWDIVAQETKKIPAHQGVVISLDALPDGSLFLSGGTDGQVIVWDAETEEPLRVLGDHQKAVNAVKFSPTGHYAASGLTTGEIALYETSSGRLVFETDTGGQVSSLSFSHDGSVLAVSSSNDTVAFYQTADGSLLEKLTGHQVLFGAFSPVKDTYAAGSGLKNAPVWTLDFSSKLTGVSPPALLLQNASTLATFSDAVFSVEYSPDGSRLAAACRDGTIGLWDGHSLELIKNIQIDGEAHAVIFTPDSQTLISAGTRDVRYWDSAGNPLDSRIQTLDFVENLALNGEDRTLMGATWNKVVRVWDLDTQELRRTLEHAKFVPDVAVSSKAGLIATTCQNKVQLFQLDSDQVWTEFQTGTQGLAWSVRFSPAGDTLAWSDTNGKLGLWDVATQQTTKKLVGHTRRIRDVAFSADGKLLASAGFEPSIFVWHVATGEKVAEIRNQFDGADEVYGVCFSPDGKRLVASTSKQVLGWDIEAVEATSK